MPIVPGLRELLAELRTRVRKPGVETVLVGTRGHALMPDTLSTHFLAWRAKANEGAGIWHRGADSDEPDRTKTFHDLRGTFATRLMTLPGGSLSDEQIAGVMGWSAAQVSAIRKRYVDEAAIVVAIGQRIAGQAAALPAPASAPLPAPESDAIESPASGRVENGMENAPARRA